MEAISAPMSPLNNVGRRLSDKMPAKRSVSEDTEVVMSPTSPAHSIWLEKVETVSEPSESEAYGVPTPQENDGEAPWDQWEQEDGKMEAKIALAALRRQMEDEEAEEKEWTSVTDMLLKRLSSGASRSSVESASK